MWIRCGLLVTAAVLVDRASASLDGFSMLHMGSSCPTCRFGDATAYAEGRDLILTSIVNQSHNQKPPGGLLNQEHSWKGTAFIIKLPEEQDVVEEVNYVARTVVFPSCAVFLVSMLLAHVFEQRKYVKNIPHSLVTVCVAVFFGLALRTAISTGMVLEEEVGFLDATFLNLLFLPIIMFDAGWTINHADFMTQFEYIMIFAVPGTMITAASIGMGSYGLGQLGWHHVDGFRENLVFGALIAATDPVATLATYGKLRVPEKQPLLNTLVMGESLLNDAVAIILFDGINHQAFSDGNASKVFLEVGSLFFGSLFVGVFFAVIACFSLRVTTLGTHRKPASLFLFVNAYLIYAGAQAVGYSGIIANLFAGMICRLYASPHMTTDGRSLASDFFSLVTSLAETGIFILCGTSCALINSSADFQFAATGISCVLLSRALSVQCCASATNTIKVWKDSNPSLISWQHKVMIWLGGLRGGIAVVLALEIGDWMETEDKTSILCTTFLTVCILLIGCGGSTEYALVALGLTAEKTDDCDTDSGSSSGPGTPQIIKRRASRIYPEKADDQLTVVCMRKIDGFFKWLLVGEANLDAMSAS